MMPCKLVQGLRGLYDVRLHGYALDNMPVGYRLQLGHEIRFVYRCF